MERCLQQITFYEIDNRFAVGLLYDGCGLFIYLQSQVATGSFYNGKADKIRLLKKLSLFSSIAFSTKLVFKTFIVFAGNTTCIFNFHLACRYNTKNVNDPMKFPAGTCQPLNGLGQT